MLGGWMLGFLLAVLGFGVFRAIVRRRELQQLGTPLPAEHEPASRDTPDDATLYQFADKLKAHYAATAQPGDVRKHPLFAQAVQYLNSGRYSDAALFAYAGGDNGLIACMALDALAQRRDHTDVASPILGILNAVPFWVRHFALNTLFVRVPAQEPLLARVLQQVDQSWNDRIPRQFLAAFIHGRLENGEAPPANLDFAVMPAPQLAFLETLVREAAHPRLADLAAAIAAAGRRYVDADFMRSIGRFWTLQSSGAAAPASPNGDPPPPDDAVVEHPTLLAQVAALETLLLQQPRSVVLVGEPGVGKTAIVRMLAQRLLARDWTFFEAGATELIAGQSYVGDLEGRLQVLVRTLENKPCVIWYVPDFPSLSWTGKHRYSPTGVLDVLLPHLESGRVILLGEAQPSAYERLAATEPRLQRTMSVVRIPPLNEEQTLDLGARWLAHHGLAAGSSSALLPESWNLAQQFLGDKSAPGNLMMLLQNTLRQRRDEGAGTDAALAPLQTGDLIVTLAQLTGLPASILDERHRLDLQELRGLFERRVLGQQEAVDCLVERVAMIKAGVTDPRRPLGVFLFAGPTGTGKTEIALTLAEFLFGSANRLIRLDMSELQEPRALERIVGGGADRDHESLVDRIRRQPFSVVLLDEFEKADPHIWDLFLQVFDAGRLTDLAGNTTDFRHAIVIMTSNLGSVIPTGTGLGFGRDTGPFASRAVGRAVAREFRPEFLNRIDRVVVFQPLGKSTMRTILIRELQEALQRRGLRNRAWAVEWGDDAIEFLLEKGFTPDLGARPLKRAIERYVLAPLALTIVNHEYPKGDQFLFVRADGDKLTVQFVDPDAPEEGADNGIAGNRAGHESGARNHRNAVGADGATAAPGSIAGHLESIAFAPRGTRAEVEALRRCLNELRARVEGPAWQQSRQAALSMTALPEFWRSPERFAILGEAEYMERIERGVRNAASFLDRVAGTGLATRDRYARDLVGRAAAHLYLLEAACATVINREPRDAFLQVAAERHGPGVRSSADFTRRLAAMYQAWAQKRGMQWQVVDETAGDAPYSLRAAVSGYGAHRILRLEDGLHVYEIATAGDQTPRLVKAHVRVIPQPDAPAGTEPSALRQQADDAFRAAAPSANTIVRRYREHPDPLVRDTVRKWRTPHFDRVMAGDFDLLVKDA